MSAKHSNISIFVPHIGCPNMCSFCNQRLITVIHYTPHASDVIDAVRKATTSKNYDPETTEIAFFGGSFTAINRNYMIELLKTASVFVNNGLVCGIRVSTRPDAVDEEVLEILKSYGVTSIELGAQSLNDRVLRANNRGHTAKDVKKASELIKAFGFSLGLQMMTGLYRDTDEHAIKTAEEIIELKPDTVRIYPTIDLKDTDLAALYSDNKYKPQTLEDAINLCAKLLIMFNQADINVIRLGLHSIEKDAYMAGPWHPAFSELCQSKIYLSKALEVLKTQGMYTIYVSKSAVSKMIGQGRSNLVYLKNLGFECTVKPNNRLDDYQIIAERRI